MDVVLAALGALLVGVAVGFAVRRVLATRTVSSAEVRAKKLVTDAEREAEDTVKRSLVEVKEEIAAMRREAEGDVRTRREEARRREARLAQREEALDGKLGEIRKA